MVGEPPKHGFRPECGFECCSHRLSGHKEIAQAQGLHLLRAPGSGGWESKMQVSADWPPLRPLSWARPPATFPLCSRILPSLPLQGRQYWGRAPRSGDRKPRQLGFLLCATQMPDFRCDHGGIYFREALPTHSGAAGLDPEPAPQLPASLF